MKAVIYDRYGSPDVLHVREVPEPPKRLGYARIRVQAAGLNPKDVLIRKGKLRLFTRAPLPRIPGYDVAGVLLDEAAGLAAGSEVYGMIQAHQAGGCAEIASLRVDEIARKPAGSSMIEAASLPLAGLTALQGLRDELGVRAGQTVLLNGASGGVGTLAIQIAKALGATVVAVCSARNAEFVRSLGADRVLDYAVVDVAAERGLDHVFDIYGTLPWPLAKAMLHPGGGYCTTIPQPSALIRGALYRVGLHRAALVVVRSRRADLNQLRRWVEDGALRPVVDLVVSWDDAAAGHAHLETRHARGKVVVDLRVASS